MKRVTGKVSKDVFAELAENSLYRIYNIKINKFNRRKKPKGKQQVINLKIK